MDAPAPDAEEELFRKALAKWPKLVFRINVQIVDPRFYESSSFGHLRGCPAYNAVRAWHKRLQREMERAGADKSREDQAQATDK